MKNLLKKIKNILPLFSLLIWDYADPMPVTNIVFEVYHKPNTNINWKIFTIANSPPVYIDPTNSMDFFICRASNILTGEVSEWNIK